MAMIESLHANPARHCLVERPANWRWSGAGWCAGTPLDDLRLGPIPPEWCID